MSNDIHEAIARWHDDSTNTQQLHEYLGMTWEQYATWAENGQLPEGSPFAQPRPRYRLDSNRPDNIIEITDTQPDGRRFAHACDQRDAAAIAAALNATGETIREPQATHATHRLGRHRPENIYEVTPEHPDGRYMGHACDPADAARIVEALNRMEAG